MKQYIMGVDLGKLSDYTAITIIEEAFVKLSVDKLSGVVGMEYDKPTFQRVWHLRHLERPIIGTPYTDLVNRFVTLVHTTKLENNVDLVVDATGVGGPVIDMMRSQGLRPIPITITGGGTVSESKDGGFHVPKSELVSALQAWYAMGRIKMAASLPMVPLLVKEISTFVPKVTKANNVSYEALREGDHDDLVLSAALAIWWAQFTRPWKRSVVNTMVDNKPYSPYDYLDSDDD